MVLRSTRRRFLQSTAGVAVGLRFGRVLGREPGETPSFSFGLVADAQYADVPTAGSRHYRASPGKLESAVEHFNAAGVAFVAHLGDLIDRDFESFAPMLSRLDKLAAPRQIVLGNHDYSIAGPDKAKLLGTLGLAGTYYDFEHGGWRFVVLDGNDVGFPANAGDPAKPTDSDSALDAEEFRQALAMQQKVRDAGRPNGHVWNGGVGDEQMAWFDKTLADAAAKNQRAVVFCHFPIVPEPFGSNLWNDRDVLAVLNKHACVAAYVNGHHHAGNYEQRGGIHFLTAQGMVETADTTAFAVVEVYADRLEVIGHGREPSRTLRLR